MGDKLVTIYDAAIQIFKVCPILFRSSRSKEVISSYADALINMWGRSFGRGFTLRRTAVINRLENILKGYVKKVKSCDRYGDLGCGIAPKSLRECREWRMAPAVINKQGRPSKHGSSSKRSDKQ